MIMRKCLCVCITMSIYKIIYINHYILIYVIVWMEHLVASPGEIPLSYPGIQNPELHPSASDSPEDKTSETDPLYHVSTKCIWYTWWILMVWPYHTNSICDRPIFLSMWWGTMNQLFKNLPHQELQGWTGLDCWIQASLQGFIQGYPGVSQDLQGSPECRSGPWQAPRSQKRPVSPPEQMVLKFPRLKNITHRIHVWYIYANIWGILMVNVTVPYIAYMDPMGNERPLWGLTLSDGLRIRWLAQQRLGGWSHVEDSQWLGDLQMGHVTSYLMKTHENMSASRHFIHNFGKLHLWNIYQYLNTKITQL